MPLLQRTLVGALLGLFVLIAAVASQAASDTGAADTGVYVEYRESDQPGAPVVDRWRLYGASHALVIGIDNYSNGWPRLSNAVKDAELVAEGLRQKGFEVELLTDVGGAQLRESLRRFFAYKGKDPQARLFVWYAGHGHSENGEGYLVPADAPLPGNPDFNYTALHMGDVGSMVRIAQSKHVLAVFDSCFSGTIFSNQRARPPTAITAAVKRPVRQFLTSGDAEQEVSDDGTFRTLFLRALRGEETADANRDGYLTGTELSFYLEDRVMNLSQGIQTPRGGKLRDPKFDQGDFVFLMPNAPAAPGAETAPKVVESSEDAAFELAFWDAIKDSGNPVMFKTYLSRYPEGAFSGIAKVRIEELNQLAALSPTDAEPDPMPGIDVTELAAVYHVLKRANVRGGPGTSYDKVDRLSVGDEVEVTGRAAEGKWLRVVLAEGGEGYVYAPLLSEEKPGDSNLQGSSPAQNKPFDGEYEGKIYLSGMDDCPTLAVTLTVKGLHLVGQVVDTGARFDFETDLDENGEFEDVFIRGSYGLTIDGSYTDVGFSGSSHVSVCRGQWTAKRVG